ncbi:MAG TPA: MarR family transcriptional regulator [Roseiflexaceae bacterium]|nr:MarR family transcriptional regulator [Roseiflexaceae bacterium]
MRTTSTERAEAASIQPPTVLQQLSRLYHGTMPVFEQYVGMSLARWRVLAHLRGQESLSQTALQQRIQVDPAAITRQVKQLEEEGLVKRCSDPNDNRFTLVSLTPTGHAHAEAVYSKRDLFEERLLQGLDEQQLHMLRESLRVLDGNLKALAAEIGQK